MGQGNRVKAGYTASAAGLQNQETTLHIRKGAVPDVGEPLGVDK